MFLLELLLLQQNLVEAVGGLRPGERKRLPRLLMKAIII